MRESEQELVCNFFRIFPCSHESFVWRNRETGEIRARDGRHVAEYTTVRRRLAARDVLEHLRGGRCLVLKATLASGRCAWAASDSDSYGPDTLKDCEERVRRCKLPLHVFPSKSAGVHLFAFFEKLVPKDDARRLMSKWIALIGYPSTTEVYPKSVAPGKLEYGLAMPYCGNAKGLGAFEPVRYLYRTNGNSTARTTYGVEPAKWTPPDKRENEHFGLKVPDGMSLCELLSRKLNFVPHISGSTVYFCYHNLLGVDGQPQGCLIRNAVHEDNAKNVRQCGFVQQGDRFWHSCFSEGCRDRWFLLEDNDTQGFESTTLDDFPSKTRCALIQLDERIKGEPRLYDILCDKSTLREPRIPDATASEITTDEFADGPPYVDMPPAAVPTPTQQASKIAPVVSEIELVTAASIAPEIITFLWPYRIPLGKLSVAVGPPDEGKSAISIDIAARGSTGRPWPDCANSNGSFDVLMLVSEDDLADTVVPRLMAAGADLGRVHFAMQTVIRKDAKKFERRIALDTDLALVENLLIRNPGVRLVVVDPLASYLGKAKKNVEEDVRRVLTSLADIAARRNVAILSIDHFNKNIQQAAIHRLSGASALAAVPRAVWAMVKDASDDLGKTRLMLNVKGNVIAEEKKAGLKYRIVGVDVMIDGKPTNLPKIEWLGKSESALEDVLQRESNPEEKREARARKFLLKYLANGPRPSEEIFAAARKEGVSQRSLWDTKKNTPFPHFREPNRGGYYWGLPGSESPW